LALSTPNFPREDYFRLIKKGLYGLKRSGSLYANGQKQKPIDLGFTPSDADECVFISADKAIIVCTYVDDDLICAQNQDQIDWIIAELGKTFKIRNLGAPTQFLGLDISRPDPRGPITLSQGT
jgi:hypothetical protein